MTVQPASEAMMAGFGPSPRPPMPGIPPPKRPPAIPDTGTASASLQATSDGLKPESPGMTPDVEQEPHDEDQLNHGKRQDDCLAGQSHPATGAAGARGPGCCVEHQLLSYGREHVTSKVPVIGSGSSLTMTAFASMKVAVPLAR